MSEVNSEGYSVLGELHELELPKGSYMVMGSGILDALGIRKAHDVDLVLSTDLYTELVADGWTEGTSSDGKPRLEHGMIEAYDRWTDEASVKTLDELLIDAEWVNGVPYNSLAKLSLYKARRGQDKDLADLALIQQYLDSQK